MIVQQSNISKILTEILTSRKEKNSQYSMRSFANQLEINSGILSQILKGKRRISKKQALKFIEALNLSKEQKEEILEPFLIEEKLEENLHKERTLFDHQKFLPENLWKVYAILNLVKVQDFKLSTQYISSRLNLDETETSELLSKIFAQRLLAFNDHGKLERTSEAFATLDNKSDPFLKEGHRINCKLAASALEQASVKERDFTSVTLAVNPDKIEQGKCAIRQFQKELSTLLESGTCKEVYKINIQLYPLTRSID